MKFRPEITRVKLNPEQAVLTCVCYDTRVSGRWVSATHYVGLNSAICKTYERGYHPDDLVNPFVHDPLAPAAAWAVNAYLTECAGS